MNFFNLHDCMTLGLHAAVCKTSELFITDLNQWLLP